jgi:hypothetical protein
MEPRREQPNVANTQQREEKPRSETRPKRFRSLKLEQRLAPKHGGTSYTGEGSGTFSIA